MSDSTSGVLAIDCGQSGISWSISGAGPGFLGGSGAGIDTGRPVEPQIAERVRAILDDTGARPGVLACGSPGLDRPDAEAMLGALRHTSVDRVALAHHSTTSYLGALGNAQGVVIACDTGVVTLAVGADEVARVDGWGWLAGDSGSAYWIGRNALEAALQGYDGRRQSTVLTEMFADDFEDLELAYLELQTDPDRVARVASYAVKVDEAAATDPVARNILDKAAAHLSEAVIAAAHRVELGRHEPPVVCALGKTFTSCRIKDRFVEFLAMNWPSFELSKPRGDALNGAALLADLDEGPLSSRVYRAFR
ncbi:BadF/BadG/BcrA/BcrD ATPase family protein [Micropruina sp.]|uniref:N-acetylglucosamine kinase n=1 Tax=Micropruina sp. TaxID=2737536 RepID=UPI002628477E|nr:BadF/BadG/BcrA/BcrD ATPase family protein [Micropruina sp.]